MSTPAIYLHHERTTTSALETDLQVREIGIDPVLKMLSANSSTLGVILHAVTQESPVIALAGRVNIGGAIDTSGVNLNSKSGDIAVSGGFSLVSFGVGESSNTASGNSEYVYLNHDGSNANLWVGKSGSGTYRSLLISTSGVTRYQISAAGVHTVTGAVAMSTTLAVSGLITSSAGILISGGTGAAGVIYGSGSDGTVIRGKAGSTNDFTVMNNTGAYVIQIATGSSNVSFGGTISAVGGSEGNIVVGSGSVTGVDNLIITGGASASGSAANPSIKRTNDGNTGIYFSGADALDFTTNGTRRFGVSSSGVFDISNLAGTGTRITTSSSAGIQGNTLSINGAYNWLDGHAFDKGFTFSDVTGSEVAGAILRTTVQGIIVRGLNGSTNALSIQSANGTILLRNPQATTGLTFETAVTMNSTLSLTLSANSTQTLISALNTNGGASAIAKVLTGESSSLYIGLQYQSSTFTTAGNLVANQGVVYLPPGATGGMLLRVDANAAIKFAPNNTLAMTIAGSGAVTLVSTISVGDQYTHTDTDHVIAGTAQTSSLVLCGGDTNQLSHGARITLAGNTNATYTSGSLLLGSGTASGSVLQMLIHTNQAGAMTIIGNTGSPTYFTYDTTTGSELATFSYNLAVTQRININAATDTANHNVNVKDGSISVSGGFNFNAFGVGAPTNVAAGNTEFLSLSHGGAGHATLIIDKTGTGTYRDFILKTSNTEQLRISAAGVATFAAEVKLGSANTVSVSSSNAVDHKVKVVVGGTTYYLLASTSNA